MTLIQMSIAGAVMIVVIILIRALAINRLPKITFTALWLVVLARLLVPISVPSIFSVYSLFDNVTTQSSVGYIDGITLATGSASEAAQQILPETIPTVSESGPSAFVIVWIIGVLVTLAVFSAAYAVCFQKLRRAESASIHAVDQWMKRHNVRKRVAVRFSGYVSSPLTYGLFRPVIVLPTNMDTNNAEKLDYVLSHELTHIRRLDLIKKYAVIIAVCLHWFNPLVWVMFIIFNRDIELACDEAVISKAGHCSRKAYAMALIEMEEKRSVSGTLYSCFNMNAVEERIVAIMKTKRPTFIRLVISAAIVSVVCLGFATTAYANQNNRTELPAEVSAVDIDELVSQTDVNTVIPDAETEPNWGWPVNSDRITKAFGPSNNPLRITSDHITIACSHGDTILSAISGIVTEAAFSPEQGNYVVVCGEGNIRTLYGHLNDISVSVGQTVAEGDKVGSAGATGRVTGVCLSFYVYINDQAVDPVSIYE